LRRSIGSTDRHRASFTSTPIEGFPIPRSICDT
jgi:hypothetical protein